MYLAHLLLVISLTGTQVFIGMGLLFLSIIAIIWLLRNQLKSKDLITDRKDFFKQNRSVSLFAICASLAIVTLSFAWTTYDTSVKPVFITTDEYEDIELVAPRTPPSARPLPPPPVPETIIPTTEDIPEPDFVTKDIEPEIQTLAKPTSDFATSEDGKRGIAPPVSPPVPEAVEKEPAIFTALEHMPLFPGCEIELLNYPEAKICSDKALYTYIKKHLNYPKLARENGIEGKVYLRFIVDSKGKMRKLEIMRGANRLLNGEAMRVLEKMAMEITWTPGRQRDNPVSVYFMLPIAFALGD